MFFSADLSSDASSVPSLFDMTEGRKFVKSGIVQILLEGCNRHNAGQRLPEGSIHVGQTATSSEVSSLVQVHPR